jgi:hypothetical protein
MAAPGTLIRPGRMMVWLRSNSFCSDCDLADWASCRIGTVAAL